MQRAATAHPVVNIFCISNFYACNEAMVRSGATSGVVLPCGFVRIGNIILLKQVWIGCGIAN